jgi:hypothetical protein
MIGGNGIESEGCKYLGMSQWPKLQSIYL